MNSKILFLIKRYVLFFVIISACLLTSCKKTTSDFDVDAANDALRGYKKGVTTGNSTDYNGYVVKTIGVSRILIAVDDKRKLTLAYLYGGGNKVILKAGTGNTIETRQVSITSIPDAVTNVPDAFISNGENEIDNGNMIDTAAGGAVFKLRGFDKSKTGYNQLNVVMSKYIYPAYITGGFYSNLAYLQFTREVGKKNDDYQGLFVTQLLTGDVKVASVELAKPLSENPYIVEDWTINGGTARYSTADQKATNVDLYNAGYFRFLSASTDLGTETHPFARNLKAEWVNADNGTITKIDDYTYLAVLKNIKTGGNDQVVEPSDTTSKAFIRISGFKKADFGYNQLRLFPTEIGLYKGDLRVIFSTKTTTAPTLSFIKNVYTTQGLTCILGSPNWPHY